MSIKSGLLAACLLLASCAVGPSEFRSAGCQACHLSTPSGSGPSIQEIQAAYSGDAEELAAFLRGERRPRVDPARFAAMQPALEIAKRWSDEERMRVAQFLAGQESAER